MRDLNVAEDFRAACQHTRYVGFEMDRRTFALLAIVGLTLANCKEERQPGVYDLSVAEVYRRLATSSLKDLVYRRQCGILIHVTPQGTPDKHITWRVRSSGRQVAEFTAILTPINDRQTKIEVRIPRDSNGNEAYDGSQFYTRPAFNQPLRPAVEEQIAALLEDRAYDVKRVGPGKDRVCLVQRGGLESGRVFRVDDLPGRDTRQSAACREARNLGGRC